MTPVELAVLSTYGHFSREEIERELSLEAFLRNADPKKAERFLKMGGLEKIEEQEELLKKAGAKALSFWDEGYPELLRNGVHPPLVLFVIGNANLLKEPSISVVGTRKPTSYGVKVTREFVSELSKYFVVVSGMAYGIDAVAHEVSLESGGKTVAVLGTGVDVVYPKTNEKLYRKITEKGCVVSEFLMGTGPKKHHFPARNRIVAGLSVATLVMEAPEKSGALITANFAADAGRDVFAVPGDVDRITSEGTNGLIKSGAYPLTDPRDVLERYGLRVRREEPQLEGEEEVVLEALKEGKSLEEVAETLGWEVQRVLSIVSALELKGFVRFS